MQQIPGYQSGTYVIDPVHSDLQFSIRHMMVAKVRGELADVEGTIVLADEPTESSVHATIDPASIDTGNQDRDNHLRSGDFFSTDEHKEWTFRSTGAQLTEDGGEIHGDLQIKGATKPVTLDVELNGFGEDAYGNLRVGATAKTRIKRSDFGITFNVNLEKGGVMLGEDVDVTIEISAVKQDA